MKRIAPLLVFILVFSMIGQALTVSAATKHSEIIQTAKQYIGTPYRYGGTTPSGFDCSGFIGYVFKQHGEYLPRTTSQLYRTGTSISKSNLETGDLVFFNTFGSGVSHAGIYIGSGDFIHSSSSRGITIDSIHSSYWSPRYLGAKRVLEEQPDIQQISYTKPRELGPGEYRDVKTDHWAYNEIRTLSQADIINGIGQEKFGLNQDLTRAEIAALIVRANDFSTETTIASSFTDVSDDKWFAREMAVAEEVGLFDHIEGDQLKPNEPVKRSEVAVMVANSFELDGSSSGGFVDVSQSHSKYDEIAALKSEGIVQGFPDGTFRPDETITRAEFSIVLYKLVN